MRSMSVMGLLSSVVAIVLPIIWSIVLFKVGELLTKHEDFLNYIGIKNIEDNYEMRKLISSIGGLVKIYAIVSVIVMLITRVFPFF